MPASDPGLPRSQQLSERTVGQAQKHLAARFAAAGLDTPALDARLLVTGALGLDAAEGIRNPDRGFDDAGAARIQAFATRRLAREPVSRILGLRPFYGLDLEISPATLDPRPDTETIVDTVLELVRTGQTPGGQAPRILDLGTGSGAIILALLHALPDTRGIATDIAPDALAVARRNAVRHGVTDRLETKATRWLDRVSGRFDVIVSNPPYIPSGIITGLAPEVAAYDPLTALDGGADGLDAYRALIPPAAEALNPGGWLVLEIGSGQESDVARLAMDCQTFSTDPHLMERRDLSGRIRCVAVRARR